MTFSNDSKILIIQTIALDALKEIQRICRQNDIKFYLRGGSVMGAIKYNGFVPWDDDTDISVPRPDYDRFIEVFSSHWSDKYWLATYRNGDAIHSYFPRLLLREEYREKMNLEPNNHLGLTILDVLPLDGVPGSGLGRTIFNYTVMYYRLLGAVHTVRYKDTISQHKGARKAIINFLYKLNIQRLYTQEWTYERLDKIYRQQDFNSALWLGTITGSSVEKEIFQREVFGDGILHKFEDTEFRIPAMSDDYLKQIYGRDYLTEIPNVKKSHQMKNAKNG